MNQKTSQTAARWASLIVACGVLAFAVSAYGLLHLIHSLRTSADGDANGMIRFFLCATVPPFFAGFRLLFRRKWAAIVVALFGWFVVYDVLSSPFGFNRFDWLTGLIVVATLTLTMALFSADKAWKRGF